MGSLTLILVLLNAGIVLAELIVWKMFHRKAAPLSFPHELDASYFRFFTMTRMRIVAVAHTMLLMVASSLLIFLLW